MTWLKKLMHFGLWIIPFVALAQSDVVRKYTVDFAYANAPVIPMYAGAWNEYEITMMYRREPIDLTGYTVWASWSTSQTATTYAPASIIVTNATGGVIRVIWQPSQTIAAPGRYMYEIGGSAPTGVSVYTQGQLTMYGSPYASSTSVQYWAEWAYEPKFMLISNVSGAVYLTINDTGVLFVGDPAAEFYLPENVTVGGKYLIGGTNIVIYAPTGGDINHFATLSHSTNSWGAVSIIHLGGNSWRSLCHVGDWEGTP